MTQTLELKVEQDHVESLAKVRSPIVAIEELIWNGLDADATQIDIKLDMNNLGGLAKIRVSDNGSGITRLECEQAFGSLGGSAKVKQPTTPAGRVNHGKYGKGRLRAFGIGPSVTWLSRYKVNGSVRQFDIKGRRSSLKKFDIGDEKEIKTKQTGVVVTIDNIETNYPSLLDVEKAADELSKRLALYLRKYPGIEIVYDGVKVDPSNLESHTETYPVLLKDKDGAEVSGELTIIEWKTPTDRALYFCDDAGFALEECPPGIQARGFHFTAYLKSPLIPELVEEGAFLVEEMHPVVSSMLGTVRDTLREHFRSRESSRASDLVKQWQEENIYPFETTEQGPIKQVEREVFDVCALKVHEYLPSFDRSDAKSKRLTFRLIKEALESNPASLHTILRQVLELPQEQQNDLAQILGRTHLSAIINAAKTVIDRLDFIGSLDQLLFGEFKQTLLELKQLHRMLVEELWIFGEQYNLAVDDQSLTEVLKKHVHLLGRTDLASEELSNVGDLEGKTRRIDLMLHRQIPQYQPNHFEHLVVELKRPSCKLGQEELGQIENYAFSVADDERFDKAQTKWTFVLIGNELSPFADRKCREQGREYGHIHASTDGSVNIYVKKWATVIAEAKWRYEFFRKKLELEVTTADGLSYLRAKHSHQLPANPSAAEGK